MNFNFCPRREMGFVRSRSHYPKRQAATCVDRILNGANPSDLPIQNPTKFAARYQPQNGEGAWAHCPTDVTRHCRRGDRIGARRCPKLGVNRKCRIGQAISHFDPIRKSSVPSCCDAQQPLFAVIGCRPLASASDRASGSSRRRQIAFGRYFSWGPGSCLATLRRT